MKTKKIVVLDQDGEVAVFPEMFITVWITGGKQVEVEESWNDDKRKSFVVKYDEDGKWFFEYLCVWIDYAKGKVKAKHRESLQVYLGNKMSVAFAGTSKKQRIDIANEFSAILRKWLTPAEMMTVVKENKKVNYNIHWCASHDFCDPNQAMIDAFEKIMERELNLQSSEDNSTINAVWQMAKRNDFKPLKLKVK